MKVDGKMDLGKRQVPEGVRKRYDNGIKMSLGGQETTTKGKDG